MRETVQIAFMRTSGTETITAESNVKEDTAATITQVTETAAFTMKEDS